MNFRALFKRVPDSITFISTFPPKNSTTGNGKRKEHYNIVS